ncbi:vanadium-dependent haloperoxidase [Georgenia yuyongxinii]|uniref:Vanadium-dependent haloperoxidase n=1 Tax=Georgenia yuyongxinii TaxID=2589797 RepID=A0A552WY43_9MICO|nr:vanadium-dependent haloperoxidase [Georgenia yuyongxinii]TRW47243.1 vanadium-dependent haloperoxidase [Georgenia yuyongxinii]
MKSRTQRLLAASITVAACATTSVLVAAPGLAGGPSAVVADDPGVVERWSVIATRTIADNGHRPPVSTLYTAFASLAVHDAVAAVEGGFETYADQPRARKGSSSEAAAATAAYEVLRHYFPASATTLHADYTNELADVGAGRDGGVAAGQVAAETIIEMREGDGRDAAVTVPPGDEPGEWVPTTPGMEMYAPWLGGVTPLLIRDVDRFDPGSPPDLDSRRYAREFDEVKAYGAKTGSARTEEQTATALFWSVNVVVQVQRALGDLADRRDLDIAETARAFALLDAATADALMVTWDQKLEHRFWRPQTAIRQAGDDDNPRTAPDPSWESLVPAPPYPDYTSGHATIIGAATETVAEVFGRKHVVLNVPSLTDGVDGRSYASLRALDREGMDARIWLGLHFRTAMEDANATGHRVADWVADRYLEPTRHDHR